MYIYNDDRESVLVDVFVFFVMDGRDTSGQASHNNDFFLGGRDTTGLVII